MKKLSLIGLFMAFTAIFTAQVPQSINYQAVARDNAGLEIVSTAITVRFSIGGSGVSAATFDYQETHATSTNTFGLFNVKIGQGTPAGPAFSAVNWNTQRFLLVEVNFGSGFEQMGTAQPFVSVPYAIVAQSVLTKELPLTATANDILSWNGTSWVATSPSSVSETTTTLVDNGNGTFTYTNELGIVVTFNANDADNNPTNEIQDLQLIGNILTITNNGSATPVDLSIYRELPATAVTGQVLTWNGTAWVAQNAGSGADNWGSQTVVTNGTLTGNGTAGSPLSGFNGQYTSLIGAPTIPTQTSQLTNNSGFITTEVDGSVTNEIQNVSVTGNALNISGGGTGTTIATNTPATNQVLTWNGTAWVAQNAGSGADNWGSQTVVTDGTTITGNGTAGNPLIVARPLPNTATAGQTITWNGTNWVASNATVVPTYAAGTGVSITGTSPNFTINNTAPNQTVALTGSGATTVSGTYPNFTVSSSDNDNQTLTKTGNSLAISGGNSINISTTAPATNQVLTWNGTNWISATPAAATTYTAGTGININGSNVVSNTAPDQTVVMNAGTGISVTGTYPNFTITNSSPNQPLTLTGSGGTTVSGTYPNLTVTSPANQTLTYSGSLLSISGGNSVTIPQLPAGVLHETLRYDGTNWVSSSLLNNTSSGIGVGTNSPQAIFHVEETLNSAGAQQIIKNNSNVSNSSSALTFMNSNSSQAYMIGVDNFTGTFKISNTSSNINAFNRIQIDPAGNVGIGNFVGVTSKLDVDGKITMRAGAINGFIPVSDINGTMTWTNPNTISPWTKSGTDVYLNTLTDEVGIGTSSPIVALHIYGNESTVSMLTNGGSPSSSLRLHNHNLTNNNFSAISFSSQLTNGGTSEMAKIVALNVDHTLATATSDLVFFSRNASGLAENMRINGAGDVGIGTSSPGLMTGATKYLTIVNNNGYLPGSAVSLELKGSVSGANATTSRIDFLNGAGSASSIGRIESFTSAGSTAQGGLRFFTNNGAINEAMRIDLNGKVGIGVTAPVSKVDISNSTIGTTLQALNSFGSTSMKIGVYGLASGTGSGDNYGGAFDALNGTGTNYGVSGNAFGSSGTKIGIHGNAGGTGTNWSGYFESGNFYIQNNVGIGTTSPGTKLELNGAITYTPTTRSYVSAGVLNIGNEGYIRLSSSANATIGNALGAGSKIGQTVIIENANATFTFTLQVGGNLRLNGNVNFAMGPADTLTLIWNGTQWLEIGRSNN